MFFLITIISVLAFLGGRLVLKKRGHGKDSAPLIIWALLWVNVIWFAYFNNY